MKMRMKMSRAVTGRIEFYFSPDDDELIIEEGLDGEDLIEYYKSLILQDVTEMAVRYPSELFDAIQIEGV